MDAKKRPYDSDAVVTYSRVPGQTRRALAAGRSEPAFDAAEVPLADPRDAFGTAFSASDLRADARRSVDDLIDAAGRPDWLRYTLVGATLAVIAGVGMVAASVGIATIVPGDAPADLPSSSVSTLAVNAPQDDGGPSPAAGVREIPLSSSAPAAQTRVETTPVPRSRPDDPAPPPSERPAARAVVAPSSPPKAGRDDARQQPATAPAEPVSVSAAAAVAPAAGSGRTDGLITSIEEALARVDGSGPAVPAVTPPFTGAPPPVVMTEPVYPPATAGPSYGGYPAPSYDLLPPPGSTYASGPIPPEPLPSEPMAGGSYRGLPVPPEPVPQAYPETPYIYPQGPGLHPSEPYAYPPDAVEETEVRRPGFLRRTLAKATGAVGRVFTRN